MDTSNNSQNRRSRRSSVLLAASLDVRGEPMAVKLRNLSAEGALVEADTLPLEGTEVLFRRKELSAPGEIVWVQGKHAGVAFKKSLRPEEVLRHVPSPRPKMPVDFRRPGLACRELSAQERSLLDSWVAAPSIARPGE